MAKVSMSDTPLSGTNVAKLPLFLPAIPVAGATRAGDARSLTGVFNIGDTVTSWDDYISGAYLTPSGTGYSGATAPTLVKDTNGRIGVKFTAASLQSLGMAVTQANPHTVTMYARFTANPNALSPLMGSGLFGTTPVLGQLPLTARAYAGSSVDLPSTPADLVPHVYQAGFNGASSFIRKDNAELVGNAGSNTRGYITLAAYGAPTTVYADLIVYKWAIHPFALDATQRAAMAAGYSA